MPLLSTLCTSLLLAAAVIPADATPLAGERWNKRIVVAFADAPNSQIEHQMTELLADRKALAERDMLVLQVAGGDVGAAFGALPEKVSADALRRTYGVAPGTGFTVILIGKDGGEKLRRNKPVSAENIFGLIDSMPMRRNEASGD